MDMYKLNLTRLQNEIFRLLCIKAGRSLNQRGLARMLKVSPTAVAKSIGFLEKEGLIKSEKSKTMNYISIEFNRDNKRAIEFKRVENLKLIYESGLVDYLEDKFPGTTIILFGSYSLGEDIETSDIDIAIIGSKQKQLDLTKFVISLERNIRVQYYANLNKITINLKSNILNGITLSGVIEL